VFGTQDPEAIADTIERFCAVHLGADPIACLFWAASVGVTAGLQLDDDREVVIKGHQPQVDRAHLVAVASLREHLARAGYPTPAVLGGPHAFGLGLATIEAYVEAPLPVDGLRPEHRDVLARGLHRFIQLTTPLAGGLALAPPEIAPPASGALWPRPHSRLFDFERTARGAETIDEIADIARRRMGNGADGELVVAHLDWRVEHVRIADGAIRTVFDWDSLHRVPEHAAVGCAAAHFAANWQDEFAGRRYPTPDESDAFVAAYADERGRSFDEAERRAIGASRTYGIAYAARCGHDPDGDPIPGAAEEMLLRFGERYLVVRG
jgi:hypothetical protein